MNKTKKIIVTIACIVLCFTVAVVPCFAYASSTTTISETTMGGALSSIWDNCPTDKTVFYRSRLPDDVSVFYGADGITFTAPKSAIPKWQYWCYLADVGFEGYTSIRQTFEIYDYLPNLYFQLCSSVDGTKVHIGSFENNGTISYFHDGKMNSRNIFAEYSSLSDSPIVRLSVNIVVDPLGAKSRFDIDITNEHFVTYPFSVPLDLDVNPSHTYALRNYFWKSETVSNVVVGLRGLDVYQEKYTYTPEELYEYGNSSYDSGYGEGYDIGGQNGYDKGYNTGYTEGSQGAYDAGYTDGHKAGTDAGFSSRDEEVEGYLAEIDALQGYKDGNDALSSLSEGIFKGLSSFLEPIFDFEFLGVKVSTAVGMLATTLVAFFVLKLIRG